MGLEAPGFQLFDLRNEDLLQYNALGVAKLHSTSDAAVWFARLQPGMAIDSHTHTDCEDNALVVSGVMTYYVEEGREIGVPRLAWVVARPGDVHGYVNRTDKLITLFLFSPLALPGHAQSQSRVFQPREEPRPRASVYETETSRGERIALRPGEGCPVKSVRYQAVLVLDGRVMCIMKKDKLALESSEGVVLVHTPAELVGASGHSEIVVFSTRF